MSKVGLEPERVRVDDAAVILGVPVRTVQALAARGEIPAVKVGRVWTFSPTNLRKWLSDREAACQQTTSTFGGKRGGAGTWSPARSTEKAYEQAIGRLR